MIDARLFPDTRDALFDLINGATHLGQPVRAVYQIPADTYGAIQGPFPVALIYVNGGTRGFVPTMSIAVADTRQVASYGTVTSHDQVALAAPITSGSMRKVLNVEDTVPSSCR